MEMKKFIFNNSLSIVFLLFFAIAFIGQIITGIKVYNSELHSKGIEVVDMRNYLVSGHFIQSTFENWESEFLQMAMFVWFTIFLKQKGSSESKKFDVSDEVDKEPYVKRKNAPWPVKKRGVILFLYKRSLTLALLFLFMFSFVIHIYGSLKDENLHRKIEGEEIQKLSEYLFSSRLWFESFQNWQSEFLSVFTIIVLSIYLRQIGSPQSKPVDAPNDETGT